MFGEENSWKNIKLASFFDRVKIQTLVSQNCFGETVTVIKTICGIWNFTPNYVPPFSPFSVFSQYFISLHAFKSVFLWHSLEPTSTFVVINLKKKQANILIKLHTAGSHSNGKNPGPQIVAIT